MEKGFDSYLKKSVLVSGKKSKIERTKSDIVTCGSDGGD